MQKNVFLTVTQTLFTIDQQGAGRRPVINVLYDAKKGSPDLISPEAGVTTAKITAPIPLSGGKIGIVEYLYKPEDRYAIP